MKNFIKSKLTLIILLAISVVFTAFASIFSVGQTVPATSYKTGDFEERNYYTALAYEIEIPEAHLLDSIWINLGSTDKTRKVVGDQVQDEEYVEFMVGRAKNVTDDFTARNDSTTDPLRAPFKVENTQEGVRVGQWQKLYDYNTYKTSRDYVYCLIVTLNAVEINEIAFVGVEEDGTDGGYKGEKILLNATALGSGMKGIEGSKSEAWYKPLEYKINTMDKTETGVADANMLIDEQSSFNPKNLVDGVYTESRFLSNKELTVAKSVKSIYSSTARTVDDSENPVGLVLISLATMIFGTTTFTLRFVPMLFAIGSIILAYFIAKKFTENKCVSLSASGVIALMNLFIVISSAFTWAIGIFFILLSIYFVLGYYFSKKLKSNDFIAYLALGGLFYALALGVKTVFVFVAPVILFAIGYIVYARYKKALSKNKDGNTRVATLNMIREIVCAVIGFIAIPIIVISISFLVVAPALSNIYGINGLLQIASKHFFSIF